MNSGFSGRWDRNRTCNLRFWSTRRSVQTRPATSRRALNTRFLATHRPAASKHVQPLCSQFCSQLGLHPSAGRRSSHELGRPDFAWISRSSQSFLSRLGASSGSMSVGHRLCSGRDIQRAPASVTSYTQSFAAPIANYRAEFRISTPQARGELWRSRAPFWITSTVQAPAGVEYLHPLGYRSGSLGGGLLPHRVPVLYQCRSNGR
jgi:hypothetical protein